MKQILFIILSVLSVIQSNAQVETRIYTKNEAYLNDFRYANRSTIVHTMPSFDLESMEKEDAEMAGEDVPFRFGKGFDVSYSFDDGLWEDVEGGRLWTISFKSEGAISVNYIFDNFYLPKGDSLYIMNKDRTVLYGPVTSHDVHQKYDSFLTDIIPGNHSTIFLFEPIENKGESQLTIKRVVHGYRGMIFNESFGAIGSSASCNNDVACLPEFLEESNAVALVMLSNGYELCSGSLLMNTSLTYDPYFLSAFHCIDINSDTFLSDSEKNNAENWLFKFCFKKTSCDGCYLYTSYTYNKADFCAAWYSTDFALMKIKGNVSQNSSLAWLGWDKSGETPSSTICIHHPEGDVMKISADYDAATSYNKNGGINNFWRVIFDYGITQGGSSGSPLLSPEKRVVGQLWGGSHSSDNPCDWTLKYYGKFSHSWTGGGTDNTRLSNWLDPSGLGVTVMPSSYDLVISGDEHLYDLGIYSLASIPSAMSVNWNLTGVNASNFIIEENTPYINQCRITQKEDVVFSGSTNLLLTAQIMFGGSVFYTTSKQLTAHYIEGSMVPCGITLYYVNPLPDNHSVEWTATGQNVEYDSVSGGSLPYDLYPYVINHQANEIHYGTLTATVKLGNDTIGTLTKNVDTTGGFSGTWYQASTPTDTVNSTPKPFYNNSSLTIIPNRDVYLLSDHFIGATITHSDSGLIVINWSNSNGAISFCPSQLIPKMGIINFQGSANTGCKKFSLILKTPKVINPLLVLNTNGNNYEFSIRQNKESQEDKQADVNEPEEWRLTIIKSDTAKKVYDEANMVSIKKVNVSGWSSGIYAAYAQIGNQSCSLKFKVGE